MTTFLISHSIGDIPLYRSHLEWKKGVMEWTDFFFIFLHLNWIDMFHIHMEKWLSEWARVEQRHVSFHIFFSLQALYLYSHKCLLHKELCKWHHSCLDFIRQSPRWEKLKWKERKLLQNQDKHLCQIYGYGCFVCISISIHEKKTFFLLINKRLKSRKFNFYFFSLSFHFIAIRFFFQSSAFYVWIEACFTLKKTE